MKNLRAWILIALSGAGSLRAQEGLPKHAPGESLDFEPKLMLDGPHAPPVAPSPDATLDGRVHQLEAALVRAEQSAGDAEQLYKEGILAKVELEDRGLRVIQAQKQLADGKEALAAAHADAAGKAFAAHEASQADLDAANAALKAAHETMRAASTEWAEAQLDAASVDLQRKRKLYREGVGSKRDVQLAEDRLVLLTGTVAR